MLFNVSIIIPTYNSEKTLPKTLNSIINLDYDKKLIKLIFVDSGSNDSTLNIINDFIQSYSHLFNSIEAVLLKDRVTTSKARNEGAKRAIPGSYLFFVDSDVILRPETLKNLLFILISDPRIGATGALYLTENPSLFEKAMCCRYLGRISEGPAGTGALLIRPEIFYRVGYFNEDLGYPKTLYEDLEYIMRIRKAGYKVLIDGRDPLLHFKPKLRSTSENTDRPRIMKEMINVLKHYRDYLTIERAYALYKVLRVAPMIYVFEYLIYILVFFLLLLSIFIDPLITLLSLATILVISSLYSIMTYKQCSRVIRILAGPAILLSRILRGVALVYFLLIYRRRLKD